MNNLHIYTHDEIKNIAPNSFNEELIREKGLENDYWLLYSKYRYFLEQYLLRKLDIEKYENALKNSGLIFKPLEDHQKNAYQKFTTTNLSYFTLLNNVYIERLSKEDLQLLRQGLQLELDFIERTYREVIKPQVDTNCKAINYLSSTNWDNFVDPNAIVLQMEYEKTGVGNTDIERTINLIQKDKYLQQIKEEIEKDNKEFNVRVL